MTTEQESVIRRIIDGYRTVAVVWVSDKTDRPSNRVFRYLLDCGYNVIPVNPALEEVHGRRCYADLAAIPEAVEVVDIFRRSGAVGPVVAEALQIGAKAVWMQEGVIDTEAAVRAEAAGLLVVMDRCMLKEHRRLHR